MVQSPRLFSLSITDHITNNYSHKCLWFPWADTPGIWSARTCFLSNSSRWPGCVKNPVPSPWQQPIARRAAVDGLVEKMKNKRLIKTQTDGVRCFFNDSHIAGVQEIISTHCRGICNHNSEVKFISAVIFSDVWWLFNLDARFLMNLMIWELNRQEDRLQQPLPSSSRCTITLFIGFFFTIFWFISLSLWRWPRLFTYGQVRVIWHCQ